MQPPMMMNPGQVGGYGAPQGGPPGAAGDQSHPQSGYNNPMMTGNQIPPSQFQGMTQQMQSMQIGGPPTNSALQSNGNMPPQYSSGQMYSNQMPVKPSFPQSAQSFTNNNLAPTSPPMNGQKFPAQAVGSYPGQGPSLTSGSAPPVSTPQQNAPQSYPSQSGTPSAFSRFPPGPAQNGGTQQPLGSQYTPSGPPSMGNLNAPPLPQTQSVPPSGTMPQSNGPPTGMMPPSNGPPTGMMPPSNGPPTGMMPPSNGPPTGMMPPSNGPPTGMMPPSNGPPTGMMPPSSAPPTGVMGPSSGPPTGIIPPSGGPQAGMMAPSNMPPSGMMLPNNGPPNGMMPPPTGSMPPTSVPHSGYQASSPTAPMQMQGPPGPGVMPPQGSYGQNHQMNIGQGYAKPPEGMYPPGPQNGQTGYSGPPQQGYAPQGPPQPGGMMPPGGHMQQGAPQHGYPPQGRPINSPTAQRKLDPEHMPSPIQVIEDDRKNKSGVFGTNKTGQLPPLVTTDFEINDEGNCGPNYMRSTVYSVPCSPDMIKQTQVPLAVAITPFAEHAKSYCALPLSIFSEEIVRCNRCKAYMCPFMQFMDGGRRFQCVFCKATTEVPQSYFAHLDHLGVRVDKWNRAELCLGSYEILATKEYCRNNTFPKQPAFIFILDVSYNAVKSGLVHLFCQNFKDIISNLPTEEGSNDESTIKVGLITYSNVVHFYNLNPSLAQPQKMVVPDVNDMFVPFLEGCLVDPKQAETVISSLVADLPKMFEETRETETILGPAIQAGIEALKASECAGKLFVFHTTLPIAEAPGKLKNRDDRKLLGTDKEKQVLTPASTFYAELGQQCVQNACSVDLFAFNNSFVDIATIGQVCKVSGGSVYKYTYFQASIDGPQFLSDLRQDVSKPIAFDAVMRVRTSTGIRPTDFYGNFYMANTTDVELGSIDSEKCISVEIKYDDKLAENDNAYIQVALLYTSVRGQRKLRLHNLCLATCTLMTDLFRNCELDVIINLFAKQSLRQLLEGNPKAVRDSLTARVANILASYRKHCATNSAQGQLILPECMKLLPIYANCLTKSDALSGGPELTVDDRAYAMLSLCSMDVKRSQVYFYPRLLPVCELAVLDDGSVAVPTALRCSIEKLRQTGAYILENGVHMFLYVGLECDSNWVESVFGVNHASRIDPNRGLPLLENSTSVNLRKLIDDIRDERQRALKLHIVRQGDKLELVLRQFLVEDRLSETQMSYVDYLCALHREIRNLCS